MILVTPELARPALNGGGGKNDVKSIHDDGLLTFAPVFLAATGLCRSLPI